MFLLMAKTTSINLRISPEFRSEIEKLAAFHGLSMSSYAHSLLVRAVRKEKLDQPELFGVVPERKLAPVVANISPSDETLMRKEIAEQLSVPVMKKKVR